MLRMDMMKSLTVESSSITDDIFRPPSNWRQAYLRMFQASARSAILHQCIGSRMKIGVALLLLTAGCALVGARPLESTVAGVSPPTGMQNILQSFYCSAAHLPPSSLAALVTSD